MCHDGARISVSIGSDQMSSYILQDFEDDKKAYRQLYNLLSHGGSDLLYSQFLELDDQETKHYWLMLLHDMLTEMTGLYESMVAADTTEYEQILEQIGAK